MLIGKITKGLLGASLFAFALAGAACQQAPVDNTANTNATAANTNGATNLNANTTTTGAVIETREPDKYTANVVVTAATSGQQAQQFQRQIKVARNGTDRFYSVDTGIPSVGEITFLDKADKRYIIMHGRKQYAELTPELTGFDIGRAMTPGQMVAYAERQQGVTRVGDEMLNQRMTTKYRVAGQAQTGTQAGQVQGESFIYVDKETGLPLRVEGFSQATGNVQGVSGGNLVVEMRDIKTETDPSQFEVPQGYSKLEPEQVRQQLAQGAQFLQNLLNFINAQSGAAAPAAAATPAPAATR